MKQLMMILILVPAVALAAVPTDLVNYSGVLRDSADNPLDGDISMVFRFWSADTAGDEILTDTHASVGSGAVTVTGGLFNVQLGAGVVADGTGPGSYLSLSAVFRDYGEVWLEVGIEGETLAPRVQVLSSPYALNSDTLDGLDSTMFANLGTGNLFTAGTQTIETGDDGNVGLIVQAENATQTANLQEWKRADGTIQSWIDYRGYLFGDGGHLWNVDADHAVNADMVDGRHASEFINTSSTSQTKPGMFIGDASGIATSYGIKGYGQNAGGYFEDSNGTGYAFIGQNNIGVNGRGSEAGGYFANSTSTTWAAIGGAIDGVQASGAAGGSGGAFFTDAGTGYAYLAHGDSGIQGFGSDAGGYFMDSDGTGWAYIGRNNTGVVGEGSEAGATFSNSITAAYAHLGTDIDGVQGYGAAGGSGGAFWTSAGTGVAYLANGDYGIRGFGNTSGGYFKDNNSTGEAYVGYGNRGIWAVGSDSGGYFKDSNGTGYAYIGQSNTGVHGEGSEAGGFFGNTLSDTEAYLADTIDGVQGYGAAGGSGGAFWNGAGSGVAYVANGDYGIRGFGNTSGGYFTDNNSSGEAYAGYGDYGIWGEGNYAGAYFSDKDGGLGRVYLGNGDYGVKGYGDPAVTGVLSATTYADIGIEFDPGGGQLLESYGIKAQGDHAGAYFLDSNGSASARIAQNHWGINARANEAGGLFVDLTSGVNMYAAFGNSSTAGSGTKNFVQNHPYDPDKLVLYSALEGDEVGTYTRGSGRLVGGEARIALGATFQWVTNPDIGLTAHITPRGPGAMLYVDSISTTELVVRSEAGYADDASFDYIVHGLRIGFEEFSVVRQKEREFYIPNMADNDAPFEKEPALRSFTALSRYRGMNASLGRAADNGLEAATALRDAIGVFNPEIHSLDGSIGRSDVRLAPMPEQGPVRMPNPAEGAGGMPETVTVAVAEDTSGESDAPDLPALNLFPVSAAVQVGDLLVLDMAHPGDLMPCLQIGDRTVVGIVSGDTVEQDGRMQAPVAFHGIVDLKVDASYGSILPGDLLTSSPTPGHAMAVIAPVQGTVVAKALEALDGGTGTIQVLVMLR